MMMTAKVLVPNKSWIITGRQGKVATVNKEKRGYSLTSHGQKYQAHDLTEIKERFGITLPDAATIKEKPAIKKEIYGFPVKSRPHSPLWNIKKKLPIYAKSTKSKSLYCAGYYVIKFPKLWAKAFCPKLITLERYPYLGPFKTESEVRAILNAENKKDVQ